MRNFGHNLACEVTNVDMIIDALLVDVGRAVASGDGMNLCYNTKLVLFRHTGVVTDI